MSRMRRSWNPIAFLPWQVTIIGSAVYVALFAVLLWVHCTVPKAPPFPAPVAGVNLTQAWRDLEYISDGYHPWGSRRNERVRDYLLKRVGEIVQDVDHKNVYAVESGFVSDTSRPTLVTVFANDTSNFTSMDDWTGSPWTLYGESTNILVYIRGRDDKAGDWWNETVPYDGTSGVLVSAHFDSVSSGYGTTDDGVGIVTILQLISHYTREGKQPKRGIVAFLNNGEENGLYGARNFVRHPLSQFPHTFLNLEGAGAGGRAVLFRSTDTEVTRAYKHSPHPFGSVVSGDGFKQGFVRSGTDYSVYVEELGLRGLDVAFYRPRSRYHTDQDDIKDTNADSVWHMLSSALATVDSLTSHQGNEVRRIRFTVKNADTGWLTKLQFEGGIDKETGKIHSGSGSTAVWFDLFGTAFAVGELQTLFALSVTLLVAGPIFLILLEVLIRRNNKWYMFAGKKYRHGSDDDDAVRLHGRRGFSRFVIAFIVATAVAFGLAFLVTKVNPMIIYGSEYVVWAMMLSAWFVVAWFLLAGAANMRPTALHRMFALVWLYVLSWILLVLATVGENNLQLASGYFLVILNASVFVALLISYLELFALPSISKYVEHVFGAEVDDARATRPSSQSSRRLLESSDHETEATERTSLLGEDSRPSHRTFKGPSRRHAGRNEVSDGSDDPLLNKAYQDEQAWSSSLPQWTWLLQFLVLVPINVVVIGQIALFLTSALHQTPADGNPVLPTYLFLSALTVLLLLPLTPFLHRFTFHVPTFLFLVFVGCLIYNLVAFPFSREARMKYYFAQQIDLMSGENNVTLSGLDGYLQDIIYQIPSAAGQPFQCGEASVSKRRGLTTCQWHGLQPNVVPRNSLVLSAFSNSTRKPRLEDWLDFTVTAEGATALISLRGLNTRMCRVQFENAVSQVRVEGGSTDPKQRAVSEHGTTQLRLFARTWDKTFHANVTWSETQAKGQRGRVSCLWDDANMPGTIPAFDELRRFQPAWSVLTKVDDGLVEGFKEFEL